jgi:uncharacterized protein with ParB-like and HNH nuclease domain
MPSKYSPDKMTLGNLLSLTNPPILVPDWQRNYSWTTSETETFWNDLQAFQLKYAGDNINTEEYFLGSVVIVDSTVSHLLLDGQQRLATAAILLSVIRDYLKRSSRDASTRIQTRYLSDFDDAADRTTYKITLNTYDRDFFKREILESRDANYAPPEPAIESHRLIRQARTFFEAQFETSFAHQATPEDSHRWALRICTVLTNHMSVVAILSEDEDNAASVFETLNDRGIGLSAPDLLRNLLLRRAPEAERQEIIEIWGEILSMEGEPNLKTFLRHYWVSRYGDVKTQSLYREIKTRITTERVSSLDLSRSLQSAATIYESLLLARDDNPEIAGLLADVNALGASVLYPALLAAYQVDQNQVVPILRALIVAYVRHTLIGKKENSRLEDTVFNLARDLRNDRNFRAAINTLRAFALSDADFRNTFATVSLNRMEAVRYILREVEHDLRKTQELNVAPPSRVHVEHIYPQNPPPERRSPQHANIVNRLGNLTLLDRRLNTAAKNAAFVDKIPYFEQSELLLNADIRREREWRIEEINLRQLALAERVPSIWAFPAPEPGVL